MKNQKVTEEKVLIEKTTTDKLVIAETCKKFLSGLMPEPDILDIAKEITKIETKNINGAGNVLFYSDCNEDEPDFVIEIKITPKTDADKNNITNITINFELGEEIESA